MNGLDRMTEPDEASASAGAPYTLAEAMNPSWLTRALAPLTGGDLVTQVDVVEVIRTTATKVRFRVQWAGGAASLCLKAFLDMGAGYRSSAVGITEADFYTELGRHLDVRVPACVATVTDRAKAQGVVILRDLVAAGASFCSALDPFTVDDAAASLEQIARLHASGPLLTRASWVGRSIADLAAWNLVPAPALQELLEGPRGRRLEPRVREAERLIAGLNALARCDASQPATLLHGDCHAGNIFRTAEGPGLIDWQLLQRGGWALDVAYHICAVLPVETAAMHEWSLLEHYLEEARQYGVDVPGREAARTQYRVAVVYGYYLWAITQRVEPAITEVFVDPSVTPSRGTTATGRWNYSTRSVSAALQERRGTDAMPKYLIVALNGPKPGEGQEQAFNEWYDKIHIPDLVAAPGVVAARRFKVLQTNTQWPYVATYEIETDDLTKTLEGMSRTRPFDPSFDRENSANIIAIELGT